MGEVTEKRCPVCGAGSEALTGRVACPVCGCPAAFVSRFSGRQGYELWKGNVDAEHRKLIRRIQDRCRENGTFTLSSRGVGYLSPLIHRFQYFSGNMEDMEHESVRQFSASERHMVLLLEDGTVRAYGENDYGQTDVSRMSGVTYVCAVPRCTYVIAGDEGTVHRAGANVFLFYEYQKGMRKLAGSAYYLAGLTRDGTIWVAGRSVTYPVPNVWKPAASWSGIADIAVATDCILGLRGDGRVMFAGRKDDARRECENWRDVRAIAADNVYAVGLTGEGRILLAGESQIPSLDAGRKEAREWRDIVAISCCRSGIGALGMDGTLHLAGNIQGTGTIRECYEKDRERIRQELRKAGLES